MVEQLVVHSDIHWVEKMAGQSVELMVALMVAAKE